LLLAGEAWYSVTAAERGRGPVLPRVDDVSRPAPDRVVGRLIEFVDPVEEAIGLTDPIAQYPLLEQALRVAHGRSPAEHRRWLGELWAGFSDVASSNPWAWDRLVHSAEEIATPTPANRLIGSPYTKLMVSNEQVDQGAALLVCSIGEAERLGVPRDRWVFPWLTVEGAAPTMTARADLARSSMAEVVGRTLWAASGLGVDDVGLVDLYSCFPSAVQQQAAGYGLALDRPLTVTGGMRFAGGPWNGYPMHAMARMVHGLREAPGTVGLCSANGGVVTKLAATVFSTRPPDTSFARHRPEEELAAVRCRRPAVPDPCDGLAGAIETWTVMHDRRGAATHGFVAVAPDDDHRGWGRVDDPADLAVMDGDEELVGRRVAIAPDGSARLG
jgi:acetyl-CoA C-acetyltransferase